MTMAHFLACFGFGCAAFSLLSWLAAMNPNAYTLASAIFGITAVLLVCGLIFDDGIYPSLGLKPTTYYTLLGAIFLMMVFGSGVVWLAQ